MANALKERRPLRSSVERMMSGDALPPRPGPTLRPCFTGDDPVLVAIRGVKTDLARKDQSQRDRDAAYRETLRRMVLGGSR